MSVPMSEPLNGANRKSRWLVVIVASCGALVAFLDVTIVSVAFPEIEHRFRTTSPTMLAGCEAPTTSSPQPCSCPPADWPTSSAGKRLFLSGLFGFTAASALCALAPSC